jgi:hypothetical protein
VRCTWGAAKIGARPYCGRWRSAGMVVTAAGVHVTSVGRVAVWAVGQLQSMMDRHCAGGLGPFKAFPITKQIQTCKL